MPYLQRDVESELEAKLLKRSNRMPTHKSVLAELEQLQRTIAQQAAVIKEQKETIEQITQANIRWDAKCRAMFAKNTEQSALIEKLGAALGNTLTFGDWTTLHKSVREALADLAKWREGK